MRLVILRATCVLVTTAMATCVWADVVPTDGMVVTSDVTFVPGFYYLPNGFVIDADNVTVDGGGATIYGDDVGYGVSATGRHGVTLRNLTVRHYFHDAHFLDCDDLTVTECQLRQTPELPEGSIFLNIHDGPDGVYGHALWVRSCDRATITYNDVVNQQNGISLFYCDEALIAHNAASHNTGWGIQLYATNNSVVRDNVADFCTRDYYGWSGADAAALLMIWCCDNNQIVDNSFVGGGDGVFLAGMTPSGQLMPSNNNYFARNDCSDSPNNGFEATFSQYNIFEDNISNGCNYGYWLGYSSYNEVRDNRANHCATAGVAIEHGDHNLIEGNTFVGNTRGVWLWTDPDDSLVSFCPDNKHSYATIVRGNTFSGNVYGVLCEASGVDRLSYGHTIEGNTIEGNNEGLHFTSTRDCTVRTNTVTDQSLYGVYLDSSCQNNTLYDNYFDNAINTRDRGVNAWNIAKTAETNIIGNPYLGGNYWADYVGEDLDGDGLGDTFVPYVNGGRIHNGGDALPLIGYPDTDGDRLDDDWETACFQHLLFGAADDPDDDGLDNLTECRLGTNGDSADTDDDGYNDAEEVDGGSDPTSPLSLPIENADLPRARMADVYQLLPGASLSIAYRLYDITSDPCDVAVDYSLDDGQTWTPAAGGAAQNCETSPTGAWREFAWDFPAEVTCGRALRLRVTPFAVETGEADEVELPDGPRCGLGDLNCDGVVNAFDIDPFVLALVSAAAYGDAHPGCNSDAADINGDFAVNAFDIDPFVTLLVGGL